MSAVLREAPPVGIRFDQPSSEYHKRVLGEASKSGLDQVAKSPAHYAAWCAGVEEEPTAAMRFGTAFHMAVLEPARFAESYVQAPDLSAYGHPSSKAYKEAKVLWMQEHAGRELISADDLETIRAMTEALRAHPLARNLIVGGTAEASLRWVDPATGLACKGRVDYWLPEIRTAVDVKTTEDASPTGFAKSVANYRYHVQDAFYRRGFDSIGQPIEHFLFVAVEKKAPHAVSVCYCDDAARKRGEQLADRDMRRLAECLRSNSWPAYGEGLNALALPAWAFYD